MIQATTDDAPKSGAITPAVENGAVVARLTISTDGDHDLTFLRYADGGVMLKQADDRVVLTEAQFGLLQRFFEAGSK